VNESVWSNGGMVLTGENWSTGRETLYSVGGRWMNVYGALVEWYWQGKTEVLREKHYTAWVVGEWMGMGHWWNGTDKAWCHLLFYFTSSVLNMFRALIYPSSGARDYSVELSHWLYCSWFDVCWSFGMVGLEWYPCCRLKHNCNTDTIPTQPHRNSNTHRTKNNTTNVVIQENSRKLLMMDILMSETRWAHKKWNKIASDIKLVFYSSTTNNVV